jgi:hypothetical protein
MSKHYRENFDSFNEIYFRRIINGGSLKEQIDHLFFVADGYMKRARIANEAEQAIKLNNIVRNLSDDENNIESVFALINEVGEKHDLVHDDLFIVAAYENFAKATLLKKNYVVHRLSKPASLKALQKKKPIHFRTVRSKKYKDSFFLEHHTIGINELLKPNYIKTVGLKPGEVYSLEQCRSMRNNIHFGGPKVYSYETKFYKGIAMLRDRICS